MNTEQTSKNIFTYEIGGCKKNLIRLVLFWLEYKSTRGKSGFENF